MLLMLIFSHLQGLAMTKFNIHWELGCYATGYKFNSAYNRK